MITLHDFSMTIIGELPVLYCHIQSHYVFVHCTLKPGTISVEGSAYALTTGRTGVFVRLRRKTGYLEIITSIMSHGRSQTLACLALLLAWAPVSAPDSDGGPEGATNNRSRRIVPLARMENDAASLLHQTLALVTSRLLA